MVPFDESNSIELPEIDKIKACLRRALQMKEKIKAPIGDSDKEFADELCKLSYDMFCYHKQQKKTFSIRNNSKIRKMEIQPDGDGLEEKDSIFVWTIIQNDVLNIFVELVARSYLKPTKGCNSRLYAIEVYSHYSGKKEVVYFVNRRDDVYLFDKNITETKLKDYISNYFSASQDGDPEIEKIQKIALSGNAFAETQYEICSEIEKFNERIVESPGFICGAITFLDFLGWKGLWQSRDAQDSLKEISCLIEDFRDELLKLSSECFADAPGMCLSSLISISDTIAVFTPKTSTVEICDLLEMHAKFSKYVLEQCCKGEFAIRGAISYGEYSIMKNIMIGPGIDECASWHETGNWIGVHLTPTAQIYWESSGKISDVIFINQQIPLKKGHELGICVRWDVSKEIFDKLALKNRALLPEIAGKYTNTRAFLQNSAWKEERDSGT